MTLYCLIPSDQQVQRCSYFFRAVVHVALPAEFGSCSKHVLFLTTEPLNTVFPRPFYTWGDLSPHMGGGQVQGDKMLMGGLMRGDIDLTGGELTLIDYIIN